jgi:hypothetical protein
MSSVMRPRAPLVVVAVLSLVTTVAGCGALLPAPLRPTTDVFNDTEVPIIVDVREAGSERFYAVRPGAEIAVDTVWENNPPAELITLLTVDCQSIAEVERDFSEGGVITLDRELQVDFDDRLQSDHRAVATGSTCEEAASQVAP